MKRAIIWTIVASLAAGFLVGCAGEDPEAGKAENLPTGRTTADKDKEATNDNAGTNKPATPL
jgi:hypothetical protein